MGNATLSAAATMDTPALEKTYNQQYKGAIKALKGDETRKRTMLTELLAVVAKYSAESAPTSSVVTSDDQQKLGTVTSVILAPLYEGEKIELGETDGKATIAQAKDVFTGYLDSDFTNWGTDKPSGPTASQALSVYEMHQNANFKQTFVPPDGKTLDDLCLTQAQIIEFCKKHRDKLHPNGWATFFLFKVEDPEATDGEEKKKYFVAYVRVYGRELKVNVYHFDSPVTWRAGSRHRIVLPQLQ